MVSERPLEAPGQGGLEADYGELFLKNFQRDLGLGIYEVSWDVSPYSFIQPGPSEEEPKPIDGKELLQPEASEATSPDWLATANPEESSSPEKATNPGTVNQAVIDCWKPVEASPWGSVEAPAPAVDTGGEFVAFWPELQVDGGAVPITFPPADVDPLSLFSTTPGASASASSGNSAHPWDTAPAATGRSTAAPKAAGGGFGAFGLKLAPPPPPSASVGKVYDAPIVIPLVGGASEVQAEAVPIIMAEEEMIIENKPKWKVFSEREDGQQNPSANVKVKLDDEVEQGRGLEADADDADVDEDACELLLGSSEAAHAGEPRMNVRSDGIDESDSEEGELDSDDGKQDPGTVDQLPRDRSSPGSSPERRPPSPPRPGPVEPTPMVTASGSRRGARQPEKVAVPASAAFQEGPPQEAIDRADFEKEDSPSKDLERKLADRLDNFFRDEDKWKQVAEELNHNPQLRESMGLLRVLQPARLRFQVDVPTPHPGIQYRRSKNLEDRNPHYAVQGSFVSGYVEDEWLRISKNLWLPFEVRGTPVLRACGEATEEDEDMALENSGLVDRSLSSTESYSPDGSPARNGSAAGRFAHLPPGRTGTEIGHMQDQNVDAVPDEGPRDVPRSSMKRLFWEPARGPDDQRSQATLRPPTLTSPPPPEPGTFDEPSFGMAFPSSHSALPQRGPTGDSAGDAAEQLLSRVVNPFDDSDGDMDTPMSRPWRRTSSEFAARSRHTSAEDFTRHHSMDDWRVRGSALAT